jgi:hypothetical protein
VPTKITLPECLMTACRTMFPTLDLTRISFYDGVPLPYSIGNPNAFTHDHLDGSISIYLRQNTYLPCDLETFYTLAHELVHALQSQQGVFGGYLTTFRTAYIWCSMVSLKGAGDRFHPQNGNCFEEEAYVFENAVRWITFTPCDCAGGQPARTWDYGVQVKRLPAMPRAQADLTCCVKTADGFNGVLIIWGLINSGVAVGVGTVLAIVDIVVGIGEGLCRLFGGCGAGRQDSSGSGGSIKSGKGKPARDEDDGDHPKDPLGHFGDP